MCLYSTSPLRRAVHMSNQNDLRELLDDAGPSASDVINDDFTSDCLFNPFMRNVRPVLQSAVIKGDIDVVRMLLDYGGDPDIRGPFGECAVHMAARYNNTKLLNLLKEYHADMHMQDSCGNFPVHTAINPVFVTDAAVQERVEVMKCLLEEVGTVSDANLTNNNDQSALHLAAINGNVTVTEYLLSVNADQTLRDKDGKTPFEVANSRVIHLFANEKA